MMNTKAEILEKMQEKVDGLKAKMESLDVRFTLGRNEARDAFDREWYNFTRFLDEQRDKIRQQGLFSEHTLHEMDKTLPVLQAILKEQIPAKESAALQWRDRFMRAVYEMEYLIRELYPNLQDDGRELFSNLRIKMELYRARLVVAPLNEWNTFSNELNALNASIGEILTWRTVQKEKMKKRLEDFGQDMNDVFEKVKGKLGVLFN